MALHDDLLDQAYPLTNLDPTKPRQVNLRRAVSSAYYSVFHYLINASVSMLAGGTGVPSLKPLISRCFEHREMTAACQRFLREGDTLVPKLTESVGHLIVPLQLTVVANAFMELQKARYDADYKLNIVFTRGEALRLLGRAEDLAANWEIIRSEAVAKVFLVSLLHVSSFKA